MTRSNKKAGPSSRKQPVWRRSRKSMHRSATGSTALRKPSLRSTPPPPMRASASEPLLDERPTPVPSAPRSASAFEPALDERPTPVMPEARTQASLTERPVALPLADEAASGSVPPTGASLRPTSRDERGSSSWMLAAAALIVVAVAWLAVDKSGSKSSNSDVAAGKADENVLGAAVAATPAAPLEAPPVADEPSPADVPEEDVIDLDAPDSAPSRPVRASTKAAPTSGLAVPPSSGPAEPGIARVPAAKAAAKPETSRPLPAAGPFDAGVAQAALEAAAGQASSCRQDGDPTGVARVVVTFAPSGRVTSATISGPPFAGTQTGSCIARTMRGMSVPAFTGDHMTISKTVVIM